MQRILGLRPNFSLLSFSVPFIVSISLALISSPQIHSKIPFGIFPKALVVTQSGSRTVELS